MSFFRKLNRSQKRKFNALPQEEKEQIVQHEIMEKVRPELTKHGAKMFIQGYQFAFNQLKEQYLEPRKIATGKEKERITKEMFAVIEKQAALYKGNTEKTEETE